MIVLDGCAVDTSVCSCGRNPPDHALLDPSIPNLIVTPHIAWAAFEARQRAVDELAANIEDFLRGGRRGRVI